MAREENPIAQSGEFTDQDARFNAVNDPAGFTAGTSANFRARMGRHLRVGMNEGLASAEDVIGRDGRALSRGEDLDRANIERMRQVGQQDLSQQSAQRGLTGAVGSAARAAQLDLGALSQKNLLAEDVERTRARRRREDLERIFGDQLVDTGLSAASGRPPTPQNEPPAGFGDLLDAVGSGFQVYTSLSGAGGPAGDPDVPDQPNVGFSPDPGRGRV